MRNCDYCGEPYSRPPSLIGQYCSKAHAYAARRKARTGVRRARWLPAHPLAPKGGYVSEARVVLYDKIGPGEHPCHWCGTPLRWIIGVRGQPRGAVIADHLDGDHLNDAPANLVPACGACNGTRWHQVGDDEVYVVRKNGTRLRGVRKNCVQCGAEFVTAADKRPGTGLCCSRSCARRQPRKPRQG